MSRKRTEPSIVPFEAWTAGQYGYILACVECYWAACAGERKSVPVYKTPWGADRHRARFDHRLEPVQYFAEIYSRHVARQEALS